MYVCICNRLKEDLIRSLAEQGLGFEEIQAITGCSSNCGSCRSYAEDLVLSAQTRPHKPLSLNVLAGSG